MGGFAIMQGAPTILYLIKVRESNLPCLSECPSSPLFLRLSLNLSSSPLSQGKLAGARIFHIINRCPAIGPPAPTAAAATPEGPSKAQPKGSSAAAPANGGGGGKPSSNDIAAAEEGGVSFPLVGCEKLEVLKGELELQGVSFAYPARMDVQIFTDFSLKIPAGEGGRGELGM